MTRRILLALDPDADTPVATRYALDVASRTEAQVTALAIVDRDSIEAESVVSEERTEQVRDRLTADVEAKVRELLAAFEIAAEGTDVRFGELVREGVPFERILDDLRFYDLLVIGKEPRFFYADPEARVRSLEHILRDTPAPVLVAGREYSPVNSVLIVLDGTPSSVRAMHSFALLKPFGTEVSVEILAVVKKVNESLIGQAPEFLSAHGFRTSTRQVEGGDIDDHILAYVNRFGADLIVAGGYPGSSSESVFAFGSNTDRLIASMECPVFIEH